MKVRVTVTLKEGVLDPQGKAVEKSLHSLGYASVRDVRVGKFVQFALESPDRATAEKQVREMCEKLLANTVIESFQYEIV